MRLPRTRLEYLTILTGVALLATACGGGGAGDDDDDDDGPDPTLIRGEITHAGVGVSGVEVILREGPAADRTATTGSDGGYTFLDVTPGVWELAIVPPDYFELGAGEAAERPLTIDAEETVVVDATLQALLAGSEEGVALGDAAFYPDDITVTPGTPVRFTNGVSIAHNVTPTGHTEWAARALNSNGQSTVVTLNNPGVWSYVCTLHSGMDGVIRVEVP